MLQSDTAECPEAPTGNHGKRSLQFQWNLADLRRSLVNWDDDYSVTVTLDFEAPGKIWMVFHKQENGCQD